MKRNFLFCFLFFLLFGILFFSFSGNVFAVPQAGTTLSAEKTAVGKWQREIVYDWSIVKTADPLSLEIQLGESDEIEYCLNVIRIKTSEDDTFSVFGSIFVTNGGEKTTENLKIVDQVEYKVGAGPFQPLPGALLTILPDQLLPGQSSYFNYEIAFTPIPGAIYRNSAKVTITNHSGHLDIEFGPEPKASFFLPSSPMVFSVDQSAVVHDLPICPSGFTCLASNHSPWTFYESGSLCFTKTVTNVSAQCNQYFNLINTAVLIQADTLKERSSFVAVSIYTGPCFLPPTVSTYTIGYWKTHSIYGPAPYDSTWSLLGEDKTFFLSGQSYYQVLWTAPEKGNAYYQLAHQYIAAKLNFLNGADFIAAQDSFYEATALFWNYSPSQVLAMRGNHFVRKEFLRLAKILDQYNNGY